MQNSHKGPNSTNVCRLRLWSCLALAGLTVAVSNAFAVEVFSWDGDSTSPVVENQIAPCLQMKGGTVIDTTERHSGSGSIRHEISDLQRDTGCDSSMQAFGGDIYDGEEIYFRWWMKIEPGFDWGPFQRKIKFARMTRTHEQNPTYMTLYLHHDSVSIEGDFVSEGLAINIYMGVDFDPSDGSCRSSTSIPISDLGAECTDWREYVFNMRRNSCANCSDGYVRFYVNGRLVGQSHNRLLATLQPADSVTSFKYAWAGFGGKIYPQLCPNGGTCGAGGTIWIDDISVDTEWNSLLASRPNAPELLTVN